ncbi:MAG: sigma-70 family RNA polymerase sigma factor [Oscillospiraceae bacterium]|jgi:RNA polymerase sigma factor (sigma-70 family)|nr:sigma-70 family RNA polymerase sigma factor [Oscillospiraceae bacterium]
MLTETEFTAAAERHLDMVYRIALNSLRHPADAEDAVQNTMLRLWRTDTDFAGEEHLRRWLARVAVNESRRIAAHPWRRRAVSLEEAREPVFQDRERRELYEAVMGLPAKYRVPLYLYYYEGYAVAEIGEILGLKPSTVQTRLSRGREKLKTMLTEE